MENFTSDQHQLVARLREMGGSSGNKSLREGLRWSVRRYFSVQTFLLETEVIQRGKGQGGSVSLVDREDPTERVEVFTEHLLYQPLSEAVPKWIEQHYGPQTFLWLEPEIVGSKGGTNVGGTWRRTDIAAASVRRFDYSPPPQLSVDTFSFEVKTIANLDVPAIYETNENSAGATYGFLLVHRSARGERRNQHGTFLRLERAAAILGVGIICFADQRDVETWECELDALRRSHDPAASDSFIKRTFSTKLREELSQQIRLASDPGPIQESPPISEERGLVVTEALLV